MSECYKSHYDSAQKCTVGDLLDVWNDAVNAYRLNESPPAYYYCCCCWLVCIGLSTVDRWFRSQQQFLDQRLTITCMPPALTIFLVYRLTAWHLEYFVYWAYSNKLHWILLVTQVAVSFLKHNALLFIIVYWSSEKVLAYFCFFQ